MRIVTLLLAGVAACGRATAPAAPSLPTPASPSEPLPAVSTAAMDAHLKYLADDLLEGRAPATRGGALAADYIAAQFEALGLEPAGPDGSYFQPVALVGMVPHPSLSWGKAGAARSLTYRDDFVAWTKSPAFAEAHSSRPPKEMFAGPNVLEVHEILTIQLADTVKARRLLGDGTSARVRADGRPPLRSQENLWEVSGPGGIFT